MERGTDGNKEKRLSWKTGLAGDANLDGVNHLLLRESLMTDRTRQTL